MPVLPAGGLYAGKNQWDLVFSPAAIWLHLDGVSNMTDQTRAAVADGVDTRREFRHGIACALGAYGLWGVFPVYFKWLESVPAFEVLLHRVVWSVVFLLILVTMGKRWGAVMGVLRNKRMLGMLCLSSLMIAGNWLVFIWAVANGRILETSLGYFLNPLISIFMGMVFLSERLRPAQWAALALAGVGVVMQVVLFGSLPWVALALALTFGFYGLLRKQIAVDSILGLFVETLLLLPFALVGMVWFAQAGTLHFGNQGWHLDVLLALCGVVTSVPLLLFAGGARRLPLMMMGLLQYLGPTISFTLAVVVYGEHMDEGRLMTFVIIWAALAIFTLEGLQQRRRRKLMPA